jgi:hypothetical protein
MDVPFPEFEALNTENSNLPKPIQSSETENSEDFRRQQHFVYLPRDELNPKSFQTETDPPAPDLGIGFDDWLRDSGIGEAPKDFVGSSVKGLPKRRRRKKRSDKLETENLTQQNVLVESKDLQESDLKSDWSNDDLHKMLVNSFKRFTRYLKNIVKK